MTRALTLTLTSTSSMGATVSCSVVIPAHPHQHILKLDAVVTMVLGTLGIDLTEALGFTPPDSTA